MWMRFKIWFWSTAIKLTLLWRLLVELITGLFGR